MVCLFNNVYSYKCNNSVSSFNCLTTNPTGILSILRTNKFSATLGDNLTSLKILSLMISNKFYCIK